jgi:hypothetical protein
MWLNILVLKLLFTAGNSGLQILAQGRELLARNFSAGIMLSQVIERPQEGAETLGLRLFRKKTRLTTSTHSPTTAAQSRTVNTGLNQPWFQLKNGGHGQEFKGGNPRLHGPAIALDARDTQKSGVIRRPDFPFINCLIFPSLCWPYRNRVTTV